MSDPPEPKIEPRQDDPYDDRVVRILNALWSGLGGSGGDDPMSPLFLKAQQDLLYLVRQIENDLY